MLQRSDLRSFLNQVHFDSPNTELGGLQGWISYITKSSELSDHIDWQNCHFS